MNNTKLRFQDITLRKTSAEDLESLYQLMTADEEWTKYNGPYFGYVRPTLSEFKQQQFQKFLDGNTGLVIDYLGRAIGSVSYYWEDENTRWLEAGVAIYDSSLWGRGIGLKALIPWVEHLFATLEIERVGFTTWSGNPGMMRCAEKLGMTQEARLRKVRYYLGEYFDSIKYGVLREEWQDLYKRWLSRDRVYLFDWGDTLMVDDPTQTGKMCDWSNVEVVSGAVELLSALSKQYPIYVATNAQDSNEIDIKQAFERGGLAQYITGYFCFNNLGVSKNNPEFYRLIAGKLGIPANKLTMTGDQRDKDIVPAKSVGLVTNWLNSSGVTDPYDVGFASLLEILDKEVKVE